MGGTGKYMDWSVSNHQKPTDKQPNREHQRLQAAHERWELLFWLRLGAVLVFSWSLAIIYLRHIFAGTTQIP